MRSMTAFGSAAGACGTRRVTVEIRSVNNRFLDWNIRLPRAWSAEEERIRTFLGQAGVRRGKVDVSVSLTDAESESGTVPLEPDLACARRYAEAAAMLSRELGMANDLTVSRLLELPGVMAPAKEEEAPDGEAVWEALLPVLTEAADAFLSAREREGARLADDLTGKTRGLREMAAAVSARSEENIRACRARFGERLRAAVGESGLQPDEGRVLTECALYADRVSIDEELVRLSSHLDTLDSLFRSDGAVGRRIDFMLQETNREINTIGSKCLDASIAVTVAGMKSELEKIREQIQNIE